MPQIISTKLDDYKTCLLAGLNAESKTFLDLARSAVTEAEALAWSTPYPHLFLPALAEEKIAWVQQWTQCQHRIATGSSATHLPEWGKWAVNQPRSFARNPMV